MKKKFATPTCGNHKFLIRYTCLGELGLFIAWILGSAQSKVSENSMRQTKGKLK